MNTNYIQLVVNPAAGSGKAKKIAGSLLESLRRRSTSDFILGFSKGKNDARLITAEAISNGASMIIAVGGDGTINEIVNGFFVNGKPINPMCELGIINCGTGGGFARTLNLWGSVNDQFDIVLQSGSNSLDLGNITYQDHAGETISRLFVNECQVGIGSRVASAVGKKSKILGGTIAFGFAAAAMAMLTDPLRLSVSFDSEAFQELDLMGLVVGNGVECAGGMKLTPDAVLNDGLFDILSIHKMNMLQRMYNLSKVYNGTHIFSPHFSIRRCKKIRIMSEIKITLEGDGEMLGMAPFTIENIPSAIRVKTGNIICQ